ncbi:hypothetical protein FRACYDRAFT_261822 [Fragilariopsis cylindrus CCMP1102]|uniref:Uncharacterized protein n=1 Tax=Fragilariopsis cylindrus CCMP1102 TaxID=635003 RepID=A0A1E7FC38_9STRA|nr:hypothetical protein FRACYDRAFT_261822 [Fragilariopsis cylindrus CCMP1102]|eukprot:OEU15742.1 hypothetical protein FRACYDRAFT_261822 [Fragilariopsis cylindrus CCMP1102]
MKEKKSTDKRTGQAETDMYDIYKEQQKHKSSNITVIIVPSSVAPILLICTAFKEELELSSLIYHIVSEGEDTDIQDVQPVSTTSAPFTSSSPSTNPTQEPNTAIACSNYGCGDYSAAENLTDNINVFFKHHDEGENDIFNDINWTAVFEVKERSPFQFLKAGVSCAYDSVRPMFDIIISTNNFTTEDIQSNNSSTNSRSRREKSFKIPNNIHINIYAIDDQLEFRYSSCPPTMIKPVIDIIKQFEINNKTYGVNTTNLRFVWNKGAMTGAPNYWEENDGLRNVTLELWVPKWILETTTILCPRIDYTLGIEIGGTVDSELVIDINTSTSTATNNNTSNTTSGSGSDSDSSSNTPSNNSSISMLELLYIDQTLNSEVRIQTDQNVNGTILMVGSNMQAAIVSTEDSSQVISDGEKRVDGNGNGDGDDISIILNGFQQVVTVMGKYEEIVLDGNSIALYTTEGCSKADRVARPGEFTACFEIDPTNASNYYSDELKVDVSMMTVDNFAVIKEPDGSLYEYPFQDSVTYLNFTNFNVTGTEMYRRNNNPTPGGLKPLPPLVVLPTCSVATNISKFNCKPLSSGSTVSTTSITFSGKNNIWSYIATSIVIATTIINS